MSNSDATARLVEAAKALYKEAMSGKVIFPFMWKDLEEALAAVEQQGHKTQALEQRIDLLEASVKVKQKLLDEAREQSQQGGGRLRDWVARHAPAYHLQQNHDGEFIGCLNLECIKARAGLQAHPPAPAPCSCQPFDHSEDQKVSWQRDPKCAIHGDPKPAPAPTPDEGFVGAGATPYNLQVNEIVEAYESQTCWFVESIIDDQFDGWYMAPSEGIGNWRTTDPLKARRYSKGEAEAVAQALEYFRLPFSYIHWRATEHVFVPKEAPVPAVAQEPRKCKCSFSGPDPDCPLHGEEAVSKLWRGEKEAATPRESVEGLSRMCMGGKHRHCSGVFKSLGIQIKCVCDCHENASREATPRSQISQCVCMWSTGECPEHPDKGKPREAAPTATRHPWEDGGAAEPREAANLGPNTIETSYESAEDIRRHSIKVANSVTWPRAAGKEE